MFSSHSFACILYLAIQGICTYYHRKDYKQGNGKMFLSFRTFFHLFVFIIIISLFYLVMLHLFLRYCFHFHIVVILISASHPCHLKIHFSSSLFHILIRPGRMMGKENERPSLSPTIERNSFQSPFGWWNGKDGWPFFSFSPSSPSANMSARLFF